MGEEREENLMAMRRNQVPGNTRTERELCEWSTDGNGQ